MNNLLRDLVVEEKIAVFINNVMIVTEMEEEHDEIVEKVLRRLEENDLFVKPKKYVCKTREVGFLGVSYASPLIWKLHFYGVIIQAHLPWQPPFLQHILGQCYNPLGILSSMVEILLFNSVFHDGITPVSVSTLKPLLGVIEVLLLKPQISFILSVCI